MIQVLIGIITHAAALLLYPGLATMVAFGACVELALKSWTRVSTSAWEWPVLRRRRPTLVVGTVALCAMLAAVQMAVPLSLVPGDERSVVLAVIALAFTVWADLALSVEFVAEPRVLLLVQLCWLLAVLGPAVQPESLRPQVLGNVLVPALLPVKVACAFLYLLCMPALLRLWPMAPPADRRGKRRLDARRVLTWFPYCGLFTTLFFPPPSDDAAGIARFFGVTLLVAAVAIVAGVVAQRGPEAAVRRTYTRAVAPFAGLVLALVVGTSVLMR